MAFVTIYCSRAFSSCLKAKKNNKKVSPFLPSNSVIVIDVPKPPHPRFRNIDKSSLTQLVKKKNLNQLVGKHGGVQGLASDLKTNLENGINGDDEEDISRRHKAFGSNTYQRPPTKRFYRFVWEALKDPTIIILLVCAAFSLGFGIKENGLKEGCKNIQIDVVRNGMRQQVSIFEIVVGDVVRLKIGDQVADGFGRMLVTSVGISTTWGEMMSTINHDTNEQTPLQARLNKLTSTIDKVGLVVTFLVLVVLLVRYFTGNTKDANGNTEFNGNKTKVNDIINCVVGIVAAVVTIVVVAIPEGLPLAVTLTLAYSMKRMMADQAMVKKLSTCETMGSATVICTDKTSTLTLNQMKVTKFWLGQESMEERNSTSISDNVLELLHQGVGLNTTGTVYKYTSGSEFEFSGSPTGKAILFWAVMELNMDMEKLKQSCSILYVEAFNSTKKRSSVSMRKKDDNTINVHWKGAAEMVLAMCSHYYDVSGEIKVLDDVERKQFYQMIQGMASSSLRCIAFAHKKV
ncbi:putative calcium-transporting ATPase 13, plasma membrane-type [Camellia lanceoleosa]|uniref:Calcium-transporting ATPase 13, plasma membrane-type n=1 Tax=Camellia lanceoleosa TaxID=1840588 RepID=A0ACC0H8N6_9ERIC|nr:putative calcium-transporting ATPase 13, plasma membrane-type [Camellia lanceoleosa]